MDPGEGSPEARAEMMNILEELGYDAEATVQGEGGPTWWQQESAARDEAAVSSAAAQAEADVQQRQEQRDAEAQAEGASGMQLRCMIPLEALANNLLLIYMLCWEGQRYEMLTPIGSDRLLLHAHAAWICCMMGM